MLSRTRQLELLSPARDPDIGIEAIRHGADAVYIGGPGFGARASAGNDMAGIARLCSVAHRYGAHIFLTLNTILRDDELEEARRIAWQAADAGVDALIIQDMGLTMLDLPPLQLHASTQCDIRTVEKARFLAAAGFSQMVLARELNLDEIRTIVAAVPDTVVEFFVHGALCVAYSGQCYVSHAQTGRSANRGDCSQTCRLPWTVTDTAGRIVAHERHVLSMKDNDQSANLGALVDAGVRSFKIEGRYKDMGYVKNVTAHYRRLLDAVLADRPDLSPASDGAVTLGFEPDPQRNFNRGSTDYFVNGRQDSIGAFDTPKHAGLALGHVERIGQGGSLDVRLNTAVAEMHNGDSITWYDLQRNLHGVHVNTATLVAPGDTGRGALWRLSLAEPLENCPDLRVHTELSRNRDMAWERALRGPSAERRIAVDWTLSLDTDGDGDLHVMITDTGGTGATVRVPAAELQPARDAAQAQKQWHTALGKLGDTPFAARHITLADSSHPAHGGATLPFLPAARLNALRRAAIAALEESRRAARTVLTRRPMVEPPVAYPEDRITYLANVYNRKAHDFYVRHGVAVVEAAYESHQELGDASLMITRHCVRFSLSLCPKQAKGVQGVQGTVRAEPLVIRHGDEELTLRFDCKPCEMHVVGRIRTNVVQQARQEAARSESPVSFYRAVRRNASERSTGAATLPRP